MKIDKNILIISIASALIIFGIAVALTFRYGYQIGLPIGLGAFLVLIAAMLIVNYKIQKKK